MRRLPTALFPPPPPTSAVDSPKYGELKFPFGSARFGWFNKFRESAVNVNSIGSRFPFTSLPSLNVFATRRFSDTNGGPTP